MLKGVVHVRILADSVASLSRRCQNKNTYMYIYIVCTVVHMNEDTTGGRDEL